MEKFRILSDLHLDINEMYPLSIKDNVFTILCGDTAGDLKLGIDWVKKNIKSGLLISGNHMPYGGKNNLDVKTMDELREILHKEFPKDSSITYLDTETDIFSKEVDGILFIGTCFYTDFKLKDDVWNKTGDKEFNMKCSKSNMNDYHYGFIKREYPLGLDNEPTYIRMEPKDLEHWFKNAFKKIDRLLNANEKSKNPKPVVLITHYPLITDYLEHNWYLPSKYDMVRPRDFNWASYASDLKEWIKKHPSIKCYCSGHIHDVNKEYRYFDIIRDDGSKILCIHNPRGYVNRCHDRHFNKNIFVNTNTWTVEEQPLSKTELDQRNKRSDELMKRLMMFW